jgi:hypothetical protein
VLCHQGPPEKRHQLLAPGGGRRRPEARVHRLLLNLLLGPESRAQDVDVESAEDLLNARAIQRDEDEGVG